MSKYAIDEFHDWTFEEMSNEILKLREKAESLDDLFSDINGLKYLETEDDKEIGFNNAIEEALVIVNHYID